MAPPKSKKKKTSVRESNNKIIKKKYSRNKRELAKLDEAEKKLKKSNPPAGSHQAKHKAKMLKAIQAKRKSLKRQNKELWKYYYSKSRTARKKFWNKYVRIRKNFLKLDKFKEDKHGNIRVSCARGELVVIVKDADGNPVEGATVRARGWGEMKTNKDGIADFGKVYAGSGWVTAKKAGHARKRKKRVGWDFKKGVTVNDGAKTTVNLIQHPICANVSFFEGSTSGRTTYFGFDHKTNLVAAPGTGEYWLPTPAHGSLSLPGNKETRDAARWVSAAVGKETEVEINYAFKSIECIPCITNSTFEVTPASIAEVVTKKVTAKKAKFKIKGKAEGEASLKVICDGNDIGWFHIWCKTEKKIGRAHV